MAGISHSVSRVGRGLRNRIAGESGLAKELERIRFAIGSLEARHARLSSTMREAEFRAFSQFGEDGVVQWLIARVPIRSDVFVELGTGDYGESNTRFLLEHDNWRGLIIDSGRKHIEYLNRTGLRWRYTVDARSAYVTPENINDLLHEVAGDVGLLSIDIDGTDYWVLKALGVVSPRIVIVEYNSVWGNRRAVSVPASESFDRMKAHWSGLYWGASLYAFCHLLAQRGYRFVGANSAGQNAFFVRDDVAGDLPSVSAQEGWVAARFRDSRDELGRLSYVDSHSDRRAVIAELPLVDVMSGEKLLVSQLEQDLTP
jgi:hypothetical protein